MAGVRDRYNSVFASGTTTERLVFFSDAVFAIAMTLLVVDLTVPDGGTGTAWDVIVSQQQDLFAYALSFAIIGLNWMGHHRKFRVIKAHDGPLMSIDLLLLFFVAFLPFPTRLLSDYAGEPAAVVLYAGVVGIVGVLQFAIWSYAWHKGFVDNTIDKALYRYVGRNQLLTPVVFGLSIPVALLISGEAAMYFWFATIPVSFVLRLWDARRPSGDRDEASRSPDSAS